MSRTIGGVLDPAALAALSGRRGAIGVNGSRTARLTSRQLRIQALRLQWHGQTPQQIAESLGLTLRQVQALLERPAAPRRSSRP
jgi:hypothetical protein